MWEWMVAHGGEIQSITGILTLGLAIVGFLYEVPRIQRQIRELQDEQEKASSANRRLQILRDLSERGQTAIWSRPIDFADNEYHDRLEDSIPIILLANLKGGVGKTTIAANLAAALADSENTEVGKALGKYTALTGRARVLAVDLDYQGSLSSLFIGQAGFQDPRDAAEAQGKGVELLSGVRDAEWAKEAANSLSGTISNLKYLATDQELADLENRMTLKWLIGDTELDARLNLFRILSDPAIQSAFDYVILDTAPRLTHAFINAMCTSTHLLVPTRLDNLSAQSAGNFLRQYKTLRPRICPQLRLLGVSGSMTFRSTPGAYTKKEQDVIGALKERIRTEYEPGDFFLENCNIKQDTEIRNAAGSQLAYFASDESRTIFTTLACEVIERTRRT